MNIELMKAWRYSEVNYYKIKYKSKVIFFRVDTNRKINFMTYIDRQRLTVSSQYYQLTDSDIMMIVGYLALKQGSYEVTIDKVREHYDAPYGYSRRRSYGGGGNNREFTEMDEIYSDFH